MKPHTIVICGNGASAALLLLALARFNDRPLKVVVIGNGSRCGAGIAYATDNPNHLLNVPAARMSADPLAPLQFQRWLERQGMILTDFAGQFASRALYAAYLDETLKEQLPVAESLEVRFVRAEICDLVRDTQGWRVIYEHESTLADLVVLATGNDMPSSIAPLYGGVADRIIDLPWGDLPVEREENVLVLGTGLTAIDVVISLRDSGHQGQVHLLSRRGIFPTRHVQHGEGKVLTRPFPTTVRGVARVLRQAVGHHPSPELWQAIMDSTRPHLAEIWQQFSLIEKRRFLRHGAAFWNVHRHRLAPRIADRFEEALSRNVRVLKGRLTDLVRGKGTSVEARITYGAANLVLMVDRVINCTGPNSDPTKSDSSLIQNIITSGHARSGTMRLGLDVDAACRVLDARGVAHTDFFALGALTRGRWWEITAIPEISRQVTDVAGHIRASLGGLDAETRNASRA